MLLQLLSRARVSAPLAAALLAIAAAPAVGGQPAGKPTEAAPVAGTGTGKAVAQPLGAKPKADIDLAKPIEATEAIAAALEPVAPAPPTAPVTVAAAAPAPAPVPAPAAKAEAKPKQRQVVTPKNRTATRITAQGPGNTATSRGGVEARAPSDSSPSASPRRASPTRASEQPTDESPVTPVTRTVRDLVEVVPEPVKMLLLALGILSAVLGGGYLLTAARARRLARQRSDLLQEVGLLQTALLPPVPATVGAVRTSVAYRPSDGPGAGGDFYDAMTLPGGRAAFILGDVSGHGRAALARTAFMRYTLRAYLEAGLDPRTTLQVAGRVIDEHLDGDFATVVLAVHDPRSGSLTYACAGHPAPIVIGPSRHEPVLAASSPPIGLGMRTGLRQTTLPLPPGSVVCLYTDGLAEARTERSILGRPRLGDIVAELGRSATAQGLLDRVAREARLVTDDMATVVLTPTAGVTAGGFRAEQLEIDASEVQDGLAEEFLDACAVDGAERVEALAEVARLAGVHGGAVLHVELGIRGPRVDVLPRNVESLEAASRRAATAAG